MQRFTQHTGIVVALPQANIDTDQIIPARFLHRARAEGYGELLFHDLRTDEEGRQVPDFPLNVPPFDRATILVAGENFGCGSSREHAVWALADFGIRAVIAPSFGDIFHSNALQNGLLVVTLAPATVREIAHLAEVEAPLELEIDLEAQIVSGGGIAEQFEISAYRKEALMLGLSEMQMTLRGIDAVEGYEARRADAAPWLQAPPRVGSAQTVGGSADG